MRRFVTLFLFLFLSVPFGITIAGCGKKTTIVFCNGGDSGPVVGQLTNITLGPNIFGISLNSGQFGQVTTPAAVDCKGTSVSASNYTYAVRPQDVGLVDVVPAGASAGRLCGGTWNRNTGGGIPDFTVCNPTTRSGEAFITASTGGAVSNALPIFVHPVVTSIVVGAPSGDCKNDLATNCCAFSTTGAVTPPTGMFNGSSCLSQSQTGQVAARVFAGSGSSRTNITCQQAGSDASGNPIYTPLVGHLTFTPEDPTVVTIDENGIATAKNPGATVINATVSNASSTAGSFSTCPPTSIVLSVPNTTNNPGSITVNQNNTQPITATVMDQNKTVLTGISLQFLSTTPTTLPSGGTGTVTPIFPGSGAITALCLPPTCNSAPLSQLGYLGNGLPLASNPITINTPGANSSILYAGSTNSLYIAATDFSTGSVGSPVRLPYVPNSMVISNDGSTIYLGSSTELMVFSTGTGGLTGQYQIAPGQVLAVSPDNTTVLVADPTRQTVSLVTSAGIVTSTYGGLATHAQFSPDSGTVYISAGNQLIVHNTLTGWTAVPLATPATDVSVAIPSVAAFLAGPTTTAHGFCPVTTVSGTGPTATTANQYYPDAGLAGPTTDRLAATNDGVHVLGATVTPAPTLTDLRITHTDTSGNQGNGIQVTPCPPSGLTITGSPILRSVVPGITASQITGVAAASDSSLAFITYTGSGSVLPFYTLSATGAGSLGSVTLSGSAIAPVAGVFSSDNNNFFVGTSGDNLVHIVTRGAAGFSDSGTINPKIVDGSGNPTTVNLLVQQPRKLT